MCCVFLYPLRGPHRNALLYQVYDDMRSHGVKPNAFIFSALLSACVHARSIPLARETLTLMDQVRKKEALVSCTMQATSGVRVVIRGAYSAPLKHCLYQRGFKRAPVIAYVAAAACWRR